jgi:hypothetical protein
MHLLTCAMGDHMVLIWEVVWSYNSYNGTAGWRRQQWAHLGWHVACAHGETCERRALKDGLIVHYWISREPKVLNAPLHHPTSTRALWPIKGEAYNLGKVGRI